MRFIHHYRLIELLKFYILTFAENSGTVPRFFLNTCIVASIDGTPPVFQIPRSGSTND
jgi:hypothetical protein